MSPQRKWQIENIKKGLCKSCTEPRINAQYCDKHRKSYNLSKSLSKRKKKLGLALRPNYNPNPRYKDIYNNPVGKIRSYTTLKERGLI